MTEIQYRPAPIPRRRSASPAVMACAAALVLGGCGSTQQGLGSLLSQSATANAPQAAPASPAPAAGAQKTAVSAVQQPPAAALTTGSTAPPGQDGDNAHGAGNAHLVVAGSRLAIYERIARNALTCWLGGDGPLKGTHVFGAEVPPDKADGQAAGVTEIGIYVRDPAQAAARGLRAYRITFEPYGDGQTSVEAANSKIAPDLAAAMGRDVETWARGSEGCIARTVRPPVAQATTPVAPAQPAAKKTKKPAAQRKAG